MYNNFTYIGFYIVLIYIEFQILIYNFNSEKFSVQSVAEKLSDIPWNCKK